MPVTSAGSARGLCRQLLMVILINIPTVSLGLAMGWVSLASGESGAGSAEGDEDRTRLVVAAATTFLASLVGVPLSAHALTYGRKFAIIATSMCFVVCWSLKLAGGGWWVIAARVAAGLGGAGAYSITPLLAREMCEARVRGAASSALILAHNLGFLLMYLAADFNLAHNIVAWTCLGVSGAHCLIFLFVPESPAYLNAKGRTEEAVKSLAWLRALPATHPALTDELAALPPQDDTPIAPLKLFRDMVSVAGRRRAFIIAFVAVVGQEACGIYTIMQFAERVFVLTRDASADTVTLVNDTSAGTATNVSAAWSNAGEISRSLLDVPAPLVTPARQAVILGSVMLVASAIGLVLVEKIGRRRLLVWSALGTAASLAGAAAAEVCGRAQTAGGAAARVGATVALSLAVAVDSVGLQPAPYALLADMFNYQYRSCALMIITGAANIASALEVLMFPAMVARFGLWSALVLAAALSSCYALFAIFAVPETKGVSPEDIYLVLAPNKTKYSKDSRESDSYNTKF